MLEPIVFELAIITHDLMIVKSMEQIRHDRFVMLVVVIDCAVPHCVESLPSH